MQPPCPSPLPCLFFAPGEQAGLRPHQESLSAFSCYFACSETKAEGGVQPVPAKTSPPSSLNSPPYSRPRGERAQVAWGSQEVSSSSARVLVGYCTGLTQLVNYKLIFYLPSGYAPCPRTHPASTTGPHVEHILIIFW